MNLINVGVFFLKFGLILVSIHLMLEIISVYKIKLWINKNKYFLLSDEDTQSKYNKSVLMSDEYLQLKELYDENLFLIRKFSQIGMNYLDFLFFQGLMDDFRKKNNIDAKEEDKFNRLKKLVWIMFSFEASMLCKKIGILSIKFSAVYAVVLILYKKFF